MDKGLAFFRRPLLERAAALAGSGTRAQSNPSIEHRFWLLRVLDVSLVLIALAIILYGQTQGPELPYYILDVATIAGLSLARAAMTRYGRGLLLQAEGIYREHLLKTNTDLWYMATHDHLTQLYNRRYFDERLRDEMARAQFLRRPLTLIIADVDRLKQTNDTFGHKVGDLVLKCVAEKLLACTRAGDVVARISGDEFAVLMPNSGCESVGTVIERLRKSIEREPIRTGGDSGRNVYVTLSFGSASFPEDGANADDLLRQADNRMYSVKWNEQMMAWPSWGASHSGAVRPLLEYDVKG